MSDTDPPRASLAQAFPRDTQDDRIRAVFGLCGGDVLPLSNDECQQTYFHYLKARLAFPFAARYCDPVESPQRPVTVMGMCDEIPFQEDFGLVCNVLEGESLDAVSLCELQLDDDQPNYQLVEDYIAWFARAQAAAEDDFDDEWDEDFEEEGDGDDVPEDGPQSP
jgi:hypothetical protein